MSSRRSGLGRGLDALIPGGGALQSPASGVARVPVDSIRPNPDQPRQRFDDAELAGLADSIRRHGILQPLVVVRETEGYRLVAGERRLRAARLAGLGDVPVVLREEGAPEVSLALSLIENIQRDNLNPIEEAEAYRRLLEEFQLTHETAAREVGKTRQHLTNTMRLLSLAPALQGALLAGAISAGHARALAGLDPTAQEDALRRVLREELNVRQTEDLVRARAAAAPAATRRGRRPRQQDPDSRALEEAIQRALQARVSLVRGRDGRGRLVIEFSSDEELDSIYRRLVEDA